MAKKERMRSNGSLGNFVRRKCRYFICHEVCISILVYVCAALVVLTCRYNLPCWAKQLYNGNKAFICSAAIVAILLLCFWYSKPLHYCRLVKIGIATLVFFGCDFFFGIFLPTKFCWTNWWELAQWIIDYPRVVWITLAFVYVFICIARFFCGKNKKEQSGTESQKQDEAEYPPITQPDEETAQILDWAKSDIPNDKDMFGFAEAKAEKIATRLLKSVRVNEKGNATIGLRGQYGSGKTTITKLIRKKVAAKNKNILFAETSAWGFDSTQSAQQYIIGQIVAAMTEAGLDTDSLIGIPMRYVQTLSKVHSVFDFFLYFLTQITTRKKVSVRLMTS
ncbi:hypothetical protein FACS18942_09150 [Planctomycetales bacterium]|nr:hypothetical protein FACS18942_09150 [Planctomycetales bacterium]GHT35808.1 hypothetical protein FACS189427_05990 [Planctomycetales bacterium]